MKTIKITAAALLAGATLAACGSPSASYPKTFLADETATLTAAGMTATQAGCTARYFQAHVDFQQYKADAIEVKNGTAVTDVPDFAKAITACS